MRLLRRKQAQAGYGLMLLIVFITSTVLIGASLQMVLGPSVSGYLGSTSQDEASARQVAQSGMETVISDIQTKLNAGTTVSTSYTYSSSNITMPNDPASLGGGSSTVGSYSATMTATRGNAYLVKVVATVNNSTYAYSRYLTLGRTGYTADTLAGGNANAMFGLRKLRSAYAGSAIRVRRSSDDTEQDIGFDGNGNLDINSLKSFLFSTPYPADQVTTVTVAFGVRRLTKNYKGYCMNVRRSSDSTTQDIGFTSQGDLDVNSLMAFVGTGTGYVTKWYDQSGNLNNAIQNTASSQPTIVVSGVLNLVNNRPAIVYDGVDDRLDFTRTVSDDFTILACYNAISAANTYSTGNYWFNHSGIVDGEVAGVANDFGISVDSLGYLYAGVGNPDTSVYSSVSGVGSSVASTGINDSKMHWVALWRKKSTGHYTLYHDRFVYGGPGGTTSTNTNSLTDPANLTIGALQSGVQFLNGSVNEVLIYNSKLNNTNLRLLKSNESWYFNMPLHQWSGWYFPLTVLPAVTSGYGMRLVRSAYAGNPIIKVRRSSDNATQDITNDGCCNLDVQSLLTFVGSGSGYIDTWYDQSGNGYHLTQPTAALQPRIVNNGVLDMMNGKPAIYFTGSSYLTNSAISNTTATLTTTAVFNVPSGNTGYSRVVSLYATGHSDWNNTDSVAAIEAGTTTLWMQRNGVTSLSNSYVYGDMMVATTEFDGTNAYLYKDGIMSGSAAATAAFNIQNIRVGCSQQLGSTEYFQGYLSEVYLYPTALTTTQRSWLEQNIEQYNATPLPAAFVTKWYDQSGNGYDAVQPNPVLQPSLVLPRYGSFNTRPTINFNGAQYLYTTGGMPTSADYSKIAVFSYFNSGGTNNIVSDTGNNHALYMHSTNNLYLFHSGTFAVSSMAMTTNQNYAVAATFQQSNKSGTLYMLNTSVGTGTTANSNTDTGIEFGAHGGYGNTLYGTISEALIFSRILNAVDRTAIYNDERGYYAAQ